MSLLLLLLTLLFVLGGVRNRGRLRKLAVLPDSDEPVGEGWRWLLAPGVEPPEPTRRAARAYAEAAGLEVLDLVPGDWPATSVLGLAELCDPDAYRETAIAPGVSGWHAVLLHERVLGRMEPETRALAEGPFTDRADFVRLAVRLKRYAPRSTGLAVAPELRALPEEPGRRRELLRAALGDIAGAVLVMQGVVYALLLAGLWLSPVWALVAIAVFHLQVPLALGGLSFARREFADALVMRLPLELWLWLRTVLAPGGPVREPPAVTALRPTYARLAAGGTERFFEPRRASCPLCGGEELELHLEAADWFQHKPGRFRLERCEACGHLFQNPRLRPEGLDYYYRDFYDGLGEEKLEFVFAYNPSIYLDRAATLRPHGEPRAWLDVGGGHGHLGLMARDLYPYTRFELLDLSRSALAAERRGWVDRGWRGLFPELAPQLTGRFDALSMSHYLEHTPAPWDELAAAARVLLPGGLLLIELPDPECPFGRWMRWTWLPWFQPQHLHFLSVKNLSRLLDEHGFEVLETLRGRAHQKADFTYAVLMILNRCAPPQDVPWRPPSTPGSRARHGLIWLAGLPFLILGLILDALVAPLAGPLKLSNTFRVVARRR